MTPTTLPMSLSATGDETGAGISVSVEDTSELAGQSAAEPELVEFFEMNESSVVCRRLVSLVVDDSFISSDTSSLKRTQLAQYSACMLYFVTSFLN